MKAALASMVLIGLAVSGHQGGVGKPVDRVRTQHLILRDGARQAWLQAKTDAERGDAVLWIDAFGGSEILEMRGGSWGAGIRMISRVDGDGGDREERRVSLAVREAVGGGLRWDVDGRRVGLEWAGEVAGAVYVQGKHGEPGAVMQGNATEGGEVVVLDGLGVPRVRLSAGRGGTISVGDGEGKPRVIIRSTSTENGFVAMDKDATRRVAAIQSEVIGVKMEYQCEERGRLVRLGELGEVAGLSLHGPGKRISGFLGTTTESGRRASVLRSLSAAGRMVELASGLGNDAGMNLYGRSGALEVHGRLGSVEDLFFGVSIGERKSPIGFQNRVALGSADEGAVLVFDDESNETILGALNSRERSAIRMRDGLGRDRIRFDLPEEEGIMFSIKNADGQMQFRVPER